MPQVDSTCDGMLSIDSMELSSSVIEMKVNGAVGNTDDRGNFPGSFTFSCPT